MRYLSVFYILLFTYSSSCNNNTRNEIIVDELLRMDSILNKQVEMIMNQKIESLVSILDSTSKISNKTVFLYNGFDCVTCIDVGYEMTKKIDSALNFQGVYIISTSSNVGNDQLRNNYENYVYMDENDIIRKELKFIYTPVFLSFDINEKVDNVFFPVSNNRNFKEEEIFINSCIKSKNDL